MGGRGAGKTRAGAEWARFAALFGGAGRLALIGPDFGSAREVMIEGPSGLKAIETVSDWYPRYNVSRRRLEWPNGAIGLVFSAEDSDGLRGPQFAGAWCDEIAIWPDGEKVWDTMQMGLRLGNTPRCVATTTPRPVSLIRRLVAGEAVVTRSATADNAAFLSAGFVERMQATYGASMLGRQELDGELIDDPQDALWTRTMIDKARSTNTPERFANIVVAIDPPVSSHARSDACGIIAAGTITGEGSEKRCFILGDSSIRRARPLDWGARAVALARALGASQIVAEANQGGEMVRTVLQTAGCTVPIRLVHARLGKRARAAPVVALYERGCVSHAGVFKALEDEMCRFGSEGFSASPDRVDALVWAVHVLMLESGNGPRVRRIV